MAEIKLKPYSDGLVLWTTAEIHTVITLVREYPQLYDRKHVDYKHNAKKELAWQEIAAVVSSKNAIQCKRKWNTLRIQQRRIYTSEQKRKGPPKKIGWHCYDLLRFLIPHMEWISSTATEMDEQEQYKGESEYEEEILDDQQDTTESVEEIKPFIRNNSVPMSSSADEHDDPLTHSYMTNVESQQSSSDNNEIIVPNETTIISQSSDNVHHQHQEIQENNSPSISIYHHHQDNNCTLLTHSTPMSPITTNSSTTSSNRPLIGRRSFIQSASNGSQCSDQSQQASENRNSNHQPHHPHHSHNNNSDQTIINGNSNNSTSEHSMSVNYFLMDIQLQMEKLNDLAQIELKIEIQKLILEKLRCPNNLRCD